MANLRCARLASKTRVLPAEAVFGVDAPTEIELAPLLLYGSQSRGWGGSWRMRGLGVQGYSATLCGLAEIRFAGYQEG